MLQRTQYLSATFLVFSFSFVATLNPNTELNPKRFFCALFLFFSSWNKIGFFASFFSLPCFCSRWGLVQKTTAEVYRVLWLRERENVVYTHTYTREKKAIFVFLFLLFRAIGKWWFLGRFRRRRRLVLLCRIIIIIIVGNTNALLGGRRSEDGRCFAGAALATRVKPMKRKRKRQYRRRQKVLVED